MELRIAVNLLAPAVAMLVFLIGCASVTQTSRYAPVIVTSNYSDDTDFQIYKTYAWLPQSSTKKEPVLGMQIKTAVDNQLSSKRLQKWPTAPDLLLDYHTGVTDIVLVSDLGYSYDRRYARFRGVSFPRSRDISTTIYQKGTFTLYFVDANTRNPIYRVSAQAVLNVNTTIEDNEQLVNKAVAKMLENYPPKPSP